MTDRNHRDAGTGQYVTETEAAADPDGTVSEPRPTQPRPSVGRVVHYVSYGTPGGEFTSQCRAAIITAVHDEDPVPEHGVPYVDLAVLNPSGLFFDDTLPYSETPEGGTWHWPERA